MATMTPTSISISLTNTSGTCWTQSGSTKKYESNLGPTSSDSTYLTVVVTSSDSSTCNYNMFGISQTVNSLTYTLPSGCTADSSGSLTYAWKLPSKTVYSVYGGVQKATTWNCTLTYKYNVKSYPYTYNILFYVGPSSSAYLYSGNVGPACIMVRSANSDEYEVIYGSTNNLIAGIGSWNTQIKSSKSSITFEFMCYSPTSVTGFTWVDSNHTGGTYTCDSSTKSVSISISMRYKYSSGDSSTTTKPTAQLYCYDSSQSYAYIRVNWGTSNQASKCVVRVYSSSDTSGLVRDSIDCNRIDSTQYQFYKTNSILNSQIGNYTCSVYSYS